jgi:quinol monooxygenase YgiN
MFLVTIRMQAIPEKREELSQTIGFMIPAIRDMEGCQSIEYSRSESDENEIFLFAEWDKRKHAMTYLSSDVFKVLLGARGLLARPHDLKLYAVSDFPKEVLKASPDSETDVANP